MTSISNGESGLSVRTKLNSSLTVTDAFTVSGSNVGIGVTPSYKLDLTSGASTSMARFSGPANGLVDVTDGTGTFRVQLLSNTPHVGTFSNHSLVFITNNTERLRIDTSGNMGIGTTSPVSRLTVGSISVTENGSTSYGSSLVRGINYSLSDTQRGILDIEMSAVSAIDNGATLTFTNNSSQFVQGYDYVGVGIKAGKETSANLNKSTYLAISTNNNTTLAERMRITSDGNVGIGTASPNAASVLDAQSTTKGVRFPNMTTTQKALIANVAGNVVFDTTLGKLCVNNGSGWQTITSV